MKKIKEDAFLLEPYNEDLGTFVEITTDQKTEDVLSTESKETFLPLAVTTEEPSKEIEDEFDIVIVPTIHSPGASIEVQDPTQAIPDQELPSLRQKYLALQQNHPLMGLTHLAIHQQKQKASVTQNHPLMALTNLAIQTARSPEGDRPQGIAPLALLIEQISQENADGMTKEKMFAMAKAMERMLEEIVAPAPASPAPAPVSPAPAPASPAPAPVSEPEPALASAPVLETEVATEPASMDDALEEILLEIYAEPIVDVPVEYDEVDDDADDDDEDDDDEDNDDADDEDEDDDDVDDDDEDDDDEDSDDDNEDDDDEDEDDNNEDDDDADDQDDNEEDADEAAVDMDMTHQVCLLRALPG